MRLRFVTATVAFALCFTAVDARAFCRTMTCNPNKESCPVDGRGCVTAGTPIRWTANRMPLVFRFQQQHSALLIREETTAAVRAAFYRWTDVVCPDGRRTGLRFVEGTDLIADKPLDDNAPRPEPFGVYFRDHGWPHVGGSDQYALTTLDFEKVSGTIVYADIEVNTTAQVFATRDTGEGVDLQTVVTHEVGHFIGLSHSVEPNTIMAGGLCESGDRCARDRVSSRRLAADDIAAVCAMYPPTADPDPAPPPASHACAVGLAAPGAHGPVGVPLCFAAIFAVALARRRLARREISCR